MLIINSVLLPNLFVLIIKLGKTVGMDWDVLLTDNFFSIISVITIAYFLLRGQLLFYKQKWFWAIPKIILLAYLLQLSVDLYRMMLFYVTMWFL
jgi:hypothetical protein